MEGELDPDQPSGVAVEVEEEEKSTLLLKEFFGTSNSDNQNNDSNRSSSGEGDLEKVNTSELHSENETQQQSYVSNQEIEEEGVHVDNALTSLVSDDANEDAAAAAAATGAIIRRRNPNREESYFRNVGNIGFRDHFSLSNPSNHLSFFDYEAILFVDNLHQIIIEKKNGDNSFTAKQTTAASPGIVTLRLIYTFMSLLLAGFLLVYCILTVLFLFLGVLIGFGLTSRKGFNVSGFFGTLLAFPVFIVGLSQIMLFAQTFAMDTWRGSTFLLSVTRWDSIVVDWISFLVFLGIPSFVGTITLLSGISNWWEVTLLTWLGMVFLLFVIFSIAVIYHEVKACFHLVRVQPKLRNGDSPDKDERLHETFYRLCLLRLKQKLSGYERIEFIAQGSDRNPDNLSYAEIKGKEHITSSFGLFSRFTRLSCMKRFYTTLNEPVRQYSVGDVIDYTVYVTKSSWGLESIFCRNRTARFVAMVDGDAAISKKQASSSLWCFGLGFIMIALAILSILLWFVRLSLSGLLIAIVIILFFVINALIFSRSFRRTWEVAKQYMGIVDREGGSLRETVRWDNNQTNSFWKVHEMFRFSEPTTLWVYWIVMGSVAIFFYFIPFISTSATGNYPIAILFLLLSLLTVAKDIFRVSACLSELGSLDTVQVRSANYERYRNEWREQHRLGKIINETSLGKRSNFWSVFFFILMLMVANALVLAALGVTTEEASTGYDLVSGEEFVYRTPKFASCSLPDNFKSPEADSSAVIDFAFLAQMSSRQDEVASSAMAKWFQGNVEILSDKKDEFQQDYRKENVSSAVTYKLIDFPDSKLKIVSIRGSVSMWDWLHDSQIWFPVMFFQLVRAALPFGDLLVTPILPYLIKAVSSLESTALENASYYKEISSFVESLQEEGFDVQIVGHSLGGGVAMISGAQRQVPSVALSGPNSVLSHLTFDPQLKLADLAKFTFNIVPDKDPVPRFDDLSEHYKRIQCRQEANNFKNFCHKLDPTICELMVACGSQNRPIPCSCVERYGYEPPESINGMNFTQACEAE